MTPVSPPDFAAQFIACQKKVLNALIARRATPIPPSRRNYAVTGRLKSRTPGSALPERPRRAPERKEAPLLPQPNLPKPMPVPRLDWRTSAPDCLELRPAPDRRKTSAPADFLLNKPGFPASVTEISLPRRVHPEEPRFSFHRRSFLRSTADPSDEDRTPAQSGSSRAGHASNQLPPERSVIQEITEKAREDRNGSKGLQERKPNRRGRC
jgi:hypothetical protein